MNAVNHGIEVVMITVNIHQAKTNLSKLLQDVMQGQEVIIAKAGVPIAVIRPISPKKPKRKPGALKGRIWISDDFDDPLPEEWFDGDLFPPAGKK